MNTPFYTAEQVAEFHKEFRALAADVAICPLAQVKTIFEGGMINGYDTADITGQLRREWCMPELTDVDVEVIVGIQSMAGLLTDSHVEHRTINWFARRGIRG